METVDVTVVGAGVVGLAVSARLAGSGRAVVLAERNERYGLETSSRNSEVIHAGMYYFPGSLKAKLCVRGRELIYEYCRKHNLPCKKIGKIINACEEHELPALEALYQRGLGNGVSDLQLLSRAEVRKLEPELQTVGGIYSPSTGIFSADSFMDSLFDEGQSKEVMFFQGTEVVGLEKAQGAYLVRTSSQEPFLSRIVINCAGLFSDKVAGLAGIDPDEARYTLRFLKGEYFRIKKPHMIARLIYSLPHELGLGIHLTPDIAGRLRLGPSAFDVDRIDYNVDLNHKPMFVAAANHYFDGIGEDDLDPDTAGVRPRLASFTQEHPDFVICHETARGLPGLINLVGIDSPGLTSALAIAEHVEAITRDLF